MGRSLVLYRLLAKILEFVIPISSDITEEELAEKQIWKSAQALLGNENCHRVLTADGTVDCAVS